ncbi:hypothetical protein ACP26L_03620 [Paenibacillus sp. S-38]
MNKEEYMIARLRALQATGVRMAIDDFRTGYSYADVPEEIPGRYS